MKKVIVTAVPPEELLKTAQRAGGDVILRVVGKESFHGITWYHAVIEGPEDGIRRFMEMLRLSRAGG